MRITHFAMFLGIADMEMPELGYSGQWHLTSEQEGALVCFRRGPPEDSSIHKTTHRGSESRGGELGPSVQRLQNLKPEPVCQWRRKHSLSPANQRKNGAIPHKMGVQADHRCSPTSLLCTSSCLSPRRLGQRAHPRLFIAISPSHDPPTATSDLLGVEAGVRAVRGRGGDKNLGGSPTGNSPSRTGTGPLLRQEEDSSPGPLVWL